jgi:hypothetical protein
MGTVTALASALPPQPQASGRTWIYALIAMIVVVGGLGAIGIFALAAGSGGQGRTDIDTTTTTTAEPKATGTVSAPLSPLAQLEGRWQSETGRELQAVRVGESVEFRVVRTEQFKPQDYRADEPRFVLYPLEGRDDTFEVEDRIRPRPPAGHGYSSAKARTTCYGVWREAGGKPLRAVYSPDRLSVDFAKIEPTLDNFVVVRKTVVSCRGLEKLKASRIPVVLKRLGP